MAAHQLQHNKHRSGLPRSLDDESVTSAEMGVGLLAYVPMMKETMAAMSSVF